MRALSFTSVLSLFLGAVHYAPGIRAGPVDYSQRGANWPAVDLRCAGSNQSPIDLRYDFEAVDASEETFFKHYENLPGHKKTAKLKWVPDKSTIQVDINQGPSGTMLAEYLGKDNKNLEYHNNYFTTKFGPKQWGTPDKFNAVQFHFHSKSEHTIEGQYFDLEMHIVHLPVENKNGFFAAALGLIFDTKNYDESISDDQVAIIDDFFESLRFDALSRLGQGGGSGYYLDPGMEIRFGELISALDTNNRWIYKGSLTTPPCLETIYWNVARKVLPIKKKHLMYFEMMLKETNNGFNGNYRVIQPLNRHDPKLLTVTVDEGQTEKDASIVLTVIIIVVFLAASIGYLVFEVKTRQAKIDKGQKVPSQDVESANMGNKKNSDMSNGGSSQAKPLLEEPKPSSLQEET